ncbi:hypothetical protein PV328_007348 [Microctonus aethiopoides]|uniref:acylphosphatase n=1 Tax=Microctonus aethiopoides TaxID=144406 RepID=A0AA39C8X0_9HYME|nr:hypothetical protein PV328_007348 [Microctonus aethiopoides]
MYIYIYIISFVSWIIGVFFRKYMHKRAEELSIKGWCMNTKMGTVIGRIEGEKTKIEEMKYWLRNTGSRGSKIDKAEFKDEEEILQINFPNFTIKK